MLPTAVASFGVSSSHACSSPSGITLLAEDVPRVELGVHVVEREADLALAVPDRPRDGARAAIARKQRRMAVDDPVPRNRERVGRDLPRKPDAEREIGLEVAQQRRDPVSRAGHDDVEPRAARRERARPAPCSARASCRTHSSATGSWPSARSIADEALDRGRDLGDEDDSHPRSKSRMRSQSVTTLSNSACSVCA